MKNRTEKNVESSHGENTQGYLVNDLNILPDDDSSSNKGDPEVDDTEETLNQFSSVMDQFKDKVISSYKSKGVKYFTKKLQQFSKLMKAHLKNHFLVLEKS